jgi:ribosomal protein S18 acetylase RimI-like enzyme
MAEFRQVIVDVDIAEVARLAREIWPEHYLPIIGQDQVDYMLEKFQSRSAIARQIAQKHEYYLVLDHGQSAGYVAFVPDAGESKLLLSKIYIRKELRGRGLGEKTLEFVEDICRKRGITIIWLTVNKNNASSIAWYERMGFTNIGPTIQYIGKGFVMDDFIMEKTIGRPQDSTRRLTSCS